ncbi:MAG TPA: RidA family protein [Terriglobia bacterium]|nr:RidA family protein [Terriglobia bacterium]
MKTKRTKIFSGTPWEPLVGYARAVQAGEVVYVSGTTGTDPSGKVLAPGDAYAQTKQAIENVKNALSRLGLTLEHVVRTRIYVTEIDRWQEVAKAHAESFGEIHPATTLVGVSRLLDPNMIVEIEATAVH